MATAFAITTGIPAPLTSTRINPRFPTIDTAPFAAWNRTILRPHPTPSPRRSRHVNRQCQTKLCTSVTSILSLIHI